MIVFYFKFLALEIRTTNLELAIRDSYVWMQKDLAINDCWALKSGNDSLETSH